MTEFELFICCLLIPVVYVLAYIAGKCDVISLFCKTLETKVKRQNPDSIVERLEQEIIDNPDASLIEYRAGLYKAIEIAKGGVSDE